LIERHPRLGIHLSKNETKHNYQSTAIETTILEWRSFTLQNITYDKMLVSRGLQPKDPLRLKEEVLSQEYGWKFIEMISNASKYYLSSLDLTLTFIHKQLISEYGGVRMFPKHFTCL
jgi:hypothetical protein